VTGVHDPGHPTEPPPGACSATRRATNSWSGGYQSEVTVTNTGDVPMLGWMVDWSLPDGQSVASLWNGNATYDGQDVMVHNADWNGALDPGDSATFGYVVSGAGDDPSTVSGGLNPHCSGRTGWVVRDSPGPRARAGSGEAPARDGA
jgi:chitin-binding protein